MHYTIGFRLNYIYIYVYITQVCTKKYKLKFTMKTFKILKIAYSQF